MHIRIRTFGKADTIVVVDSKLSKIQELRHIVHEKFDVEPSLQRLFYGGKLLDDEYTFHDYNIKLNDVIQLMVKAQPQFNASSEAPIKCDEDTHNDTVKQSESNKKVYIDAKSTLYSIGDLVDVKDREQGSWLEGKVVRIVCEPSPPRDVQDVELSDRENDAENKPPDEKADTNSKKEGIEKYFTMTPVRKKKYDKYSNRVESVNEVLYNVQLDGDEEESELYCRAEEIRPRARTVLEVEELKVGTTVMINYNMEYPAEKGYWYDLTVHEVRKLRSGYEVLGALQLGAGATADAGAAPLVAVRLHDRVFAVEQPGSAPPLPAPPPRSKPLNCLTCRDDENEPCQDCGCCVCSGKERPEEIILCDECDRGFHMRCLSPALGALPADDWYCDACRRDARVVAPGLLPQPRKPRAPRARDWGRGMACAGKTKSCAMPTNHFGPIPGIEVGMCWKFRIQVSECGVHRPPVSGIHGRDVDGAYSIVLSGGYEDDYDAGDEFSYTGSGGRDLSGNKRTAEQSCDQSLTRENKALARNCAAALNTAGADAGELWRAGRPVRVVRSAKMLRHAPRFAPREGIRYDGIYKVVKYYPEQGLSGHLVWKYLLRRDDPAPPPWDPAASRYPIIYPDGYLEAEAEKRALKEKNSKLSKEGKKRALRESGVSPEPDRAAKRRNTGRVHTSSKAASSEGENVKSTSSSGAPGVSETVRRALLADRRNRREWSECLDAAADHKELVEATTRTFVCIICQQVAAAPVTTPCLHHFCAACLTRAAAVAGVEAVPCPCCRRTVPGARSLPPDEPLRDALRAVLPGYDAGRL